MNQPLAIVGAGSMGQTFAGCLARAGASITVLATPRTASQLLNTGELRLRGATELAYPVVAGAGGPSAIGVIVDPRELPAGAGLIFTPKGPHLPEAIAQVRAAWPRPDDAQAWVCGIQNGVVKDDLLTEAFGASRVVGAASIVGAERQADGRVAVSNMDTTYLGELGDRSGDAPSARVARTAELLNRAGLATQVVDNIQTVLWSKLCNTAGFFAATCTGRIPNFALGLHPELVAVYLGVMRETAAVASAHGIRVQDFPRFPVRTYLDRSDEANTAFFHQLATSASTSIAGSTDQRTSMLQDLLAGRPMEVEAIFGDLVARAGRLGVPVPHLTEVRDALRAVDPGRQAPA